MMDTQASCKWCYACYQKFMTLKLNQASDRVPPFAERLESGPEDLFPNHPDVRGPSSAVWYGYMNHIVELAEQLSQASTRATDIHRFKGVILEAYKNKLKIKDEKYESRHQWEEIPGSEVKGGFGVCSMAYDSDTRQYFAVKKIEMSQFDAKEVYVLGKLQQQSEHPHIVRLYGLLYRQDFVYILMEFVGGGDLAEMMDEVQWNQGLLFYYTLLHVLSFVHSLDAWHGDVKEQNVLLRENRYDIVLIDFGNAGMLQPLEASDSPRRSPDLLCCSNGRFIDIVGATCIFERGLDGKEKDIPEKYIKQFMLPDKNIPDQPLKTVLKDLLAKGKEDVSAVDLLRHPAFRVISDGLEESAGFTAAKDLRYNNLVEPNTKIDNSLRESDVSVEEGKISLRPTGQNPVLPNLEIFKDN